MDFTKFDVRGKAETGKAFPILHPETLEPLVEGDKHAMFVIRGYSSPSVQAAQAKLLADKMALAADDKVYSMEALHRDTIREALTLVVGFENVELKGVPVTVENAEAFFNLVFPRAVKDPETGLFKTANKTFAVQVLQYAATLDAELGNV